MYFIYLIYYSHLNLNGLYLSTNFYLYLIKEFIQNYLSHAKIKQINLFTNWNQFFKFFINCLDFQNINHFLNI